MGEAKFTKGATVEVSSEEEGLRGSFYTAKIVKVLTGKKRLVVEYETLFSDEDGNKPLQETVDYSRVRPCPPQTVRKRGVVFDVSQEVDAFYNDGWWVGVVSKPLSRNKYRVYFKEYGEEMVFGVTQLRVHQEWINGRWLVDSLGTDRLITEGTRVSSRGKEGHLFLPWKEIHNQSDNDPTEGLGKEFLTIESSGDKSNHSDDSDGDGVEMFVIRKKVIDLVSSDDDV